MTDFTQISRTNNMTPFQLTVEYVRYVDLIAKLYCAQETLGSLDHLYQHDDSETFITEAQNEIGKAIRSLSLQRDALNTAIRLRMGETQESVDIPF